MQHFFVRDGGIYKKIKTDEIEYVEALKNYIKIVTATETHVLIFSLKGMEEFLPSHRFRRIHKSFIISLNKITAFDKYKVYLKNKQLPIGLIYRNDFEIAVLENDSLVIQNSKIRGVAHMDDIIHENCMLETG